MKFSAFLGLVLLALTLTGGFILWQMVKVGGIKSVMGIFASSKVAQKINQVSDKYSDKTVPQANNGVYRGRYKDLLGNKVKLDINGSDMEFTMDNQTTYNCQPRTMKLADGSKKDILEMNLDFSKYKGGRMGGVADVSKFKEAVIIGDIVMVYIGEKFGSQSDIAGSVAIISDTCKL